MLITVDPTGHVRKFGMSAVPAGYLACDGSVLNRSTYPSLFSVIGTTFNIGGETTAQFRLPDLRGKARVGSGQDTGRSLTNRAAGSYHGEETHPLVVGELPTHTHSGTTDISSDAHTHTGSNAGSISINHNHQYTFTGNRGNANNCSPRPISCLSGPQTGGANISLVHAHSVAITGLSATHIHSTYTTDNGAGLTGSGHNNMMPSAVGLPCIKY